MPYTINNSRAVTSLSIVKLNSTAYANLVDSGTLDENKIYIVESAGGGSSSSSGSISLEDLPIATSSTLGIVAVPTDGGLTVDTSGNIRVSNSLPLATTFTSTTDSNDTASGAVVISGGLGVASNIHANKVYGAVWNDYAEYRSSNKIVAPGHAVYEIGDDSVAITTKRLQYGCSIVSDTFGFAIGETETAKTPLTVSGRVLAYPFEDKGIFKNHIGEFVCSGPKGTVSIMTKEEVQKYPEAIIGSISAVPDYLIWGKDNTLVDGRVWIKIK